MATKRWYKKSQPTFAFDWRKAKAPSFVVLEEDRGIIFMFDVEKRDFIANHDTWEYPLRSGSMQELKRKIDRKYTPITILNKHLLGKHVMFKARGGYRDPQIWCLGTVKAVRESAKRLDRIELVLSGDDGAEYVAEPDELYHGTKKDAKALSRLSRQWAEAEGAYEALKDKLQMFNHQKINEMKSTIAQERWKQKLETSQKTIDRSTKTS